MKTFKQLIGVFIILILASGCQKEKGLKWTGITIHLKDIETNTLVSNVDFEVYGRKSGDGLTTHTKESIDLSGRIINGLFEGGFTAKRSSWHYYLVFDPDFEADYDFINAPVSSFLIEKFEANTFTFSVAKTYKTVFKVNNLDCDDIADKITLLMRHKLYDPVNKLNPENDEWDTALAIHGCGTQEILAKYPTGAYELGVKVRKSGVVTYAFYEVTIDSLGQNEIEIDY